MQSRQIHINVCNLAGESFELKLPLQATVAQLKVQVEEYWNIPTSCQRLFVDAHILGHHEQLSDHCHTDVDLAVTLVLCWDEIITTLQDASSDCTIQALEAIKRLGPNAGEQGRCAVVQLLQDPRNCIRVAAVGTLGSILSDTDNYRISLLGQCLADPCSRVRSATVSMLSKNATKHSSADCAFEVVSTHLQHPEAFVRRSAVCLASRLKDKLEMSKVWITLNLLFESYLPEVRATALEVLSQLATQGDQHALGVALARLDDPDACVRCAALAAVGCLVISRGDRDVVGQVIACLSDTRDDVRQTVLSQLPRLVSQNDERTIETVSKYLEHPNAGVRLDVPSALLKVASRGNHFALGSVATRLGHSSHDVRQAAVYTLDCLATGAEDSAVHVLAPYSDHAEPVARAAAIQLLSKFQQHGAGINVAVQKLADQDQCVRLAALEAITRTAPCNDANVIDAMSQLLGSTNAHIRLVALKALGRISKRSNKRVISILTKCLQDTSPDVRVVAAEALACISSRGDTVALSALRACRRSDKDRGQGVVAAVHKAESKIRSGVAVH